MSGEFAVYYKDSVFKHYLGPKVEDGTTDDKQKKKSKKSKKQKNK